MQGINPTLIQFIRMHSSKLSTSNVKAEISYASLQKKKKVFVIEI